MPHAVQRAELQAAHTVIRDVVGRIPVGGTVSLDLVSSVYADACWRCPGCTKAEWLGRAQPPLMKMCKACGMAVEITKFGPDPSL